MIRKVVTVTDPFPITRATLEDAIRNYGTLLDKIIIAKISNSEGGYYIEKLHKIGDRFVFINLLNSKCKWAEPQLLEDFIHEQLSVTHEIFVMDTKEDLARFLTELC
jgi:hypothetical protein